MSDSTPVPPKEIERAIDALMKRCEDHTRDGAKNPAAECGFCSVARKKLVAAIASYTLSPEEARACVEAFENTSGNEEDTPLKIKLRRIAASTEEASAGAAVGAQRGEK